MTSPRATEATRAVGDLRAESDAERTRWWMVPAACLLTLYLIGTSRWGSYVSAPGLPFYIGDALFGVALLQLAVALRRGDADLRRLLRAPLVLKLALCLAGWAAFRSLVEHNVDLVSLRDLAPYAYALIALPAFLVPIRQARWTLAIYLVLAFHVAWVAGLPLIPGFPWSLPVLGTDATLLVARPDFDSAVCGVAIAFALRDLLMPRESRTRTRTLLLVALIVANAYGIATLETRAGLLSALLAVAAVLFTLPRGSGRRRGRLKAAATAAVVVAACAAALLTPTGSRLVEGLDASSSQARGTVDVRQTVWDRVGAFVLRSPGRTAIGVGFGRNFIEESGSRQALEGETFQNVRSPHNYLIGTLARLGVAGALLAGGVVLLGWLLAFQILRSEQIGSVTVLAALLCVALPVTAMLGVVLESPFGALPYFWAIGVIAAARLACDDQVELNSSPVDEDP